MPLDPDDVARRVEEWVWVPEDARTVQTEEFLVVAYPSHFAEPTFVVRLTGDAPADALLDRVLDAAASLGRDDVVVQVGHGTPAGVEPALLARLAPLTETLAVLALDLTAPRPALAPALDVELRPVRDAADAVALEHLDVEVFGGTLRPDAEIAAAFAERGPDPGQTLAWRGGELVGYAGATAVDGTLRLWGGGVAATSRGTGVYRALLDHRLRVGAHEGCTVAVVKGRVETSAPTLLRAGFERYGEQRAYRLTRLTR